MQEIKELKKGGDQNAQKVFAIREKNRPLTALLKGKTGHQQLEEYPQEVDYHLKPDEERKKELEAEREKVKKEVDKAEGERLEKTLRRKNDLENRISELEKEQQRSAFKKYLSYITNNERL